MSNGFLGSLSVLLASTGLALAQPAQIPTSITAAGTAQPAASAEPACDQPVETADEADFSGPAYGQAAHPELNPEIPPRTTSDDYRQACEDSAKGSYPSYEWYGGAEYLHWWLKGVPTPPLVTTAPIGSSGILGAPGTLVLIGSNSFSSLQEDGGRFTLGTSLGPCTSVEATYFFVSQGHTASVNSPGTIVLSRPFFNVVTGMEDAAGVSLPGLVSGGVQVREDSRIWGGEVNFREKVKCTDHFTLHVLLGGRFIELDEGLLINENLAVLPTVPVLGGLSAVSADDFGTRNRFYAGQVGAEAEWDFGPVFVNVRAKLAMGVNDEVATIEGKTVNSTAPTTVVNGALLALPTNIGRHSRTIFSVAPEAGLNVGCVLNEYFRASVGYNFLYISEVLRPGNQIDRSINTAQGIPGSFGTGGPAIPPRPAFNFNGSDFWVQGVTVSLEFRF